LQFCPFISGGFGAKVAILPLYFRGLRRKNCNFVPLFPDFSAQKIAILSRYFRVLRRKICNFAPLFPGFSAQNSDLQEHGFTFLGDNWLTTPI
jgi:hypothetical protein